LRLRARVAPGSHPHRRPALQHLGRQGEHAGTTCRAPGEW
jgi:hypothetical protein